jgi:DNA-binding CsgD family transcriptional regulator
MSGNDNQTSGSLSDRELQIVELVAAGLTNQEIAEKLEISKRTVDNHISNILTKTATGNRVALVRWALQWGKVCIDEVTCCTLPLPTNALPVPIEADLVKADSVEPVAAEPASVLSDEIVS